MNPKEGRIKSYRLNNLRSYDINSPINGDERKKCSKCGVWQNWEEFHKQGKRRESRCKKCIAKLKRQYRAKKKKMKQKKYTDESKFRVRIVGKLSPATIEKVSKLIIRSYFETRGKYET